VAGRRWPALSGRAGRILIYIVSAAVFGAAGWRLIGEKIFPGGDEPHYLVITQSLIKDHDLKIENNHQRGDYHEYFGPTIRPDYLTRGVDHQIYSVHPVGLPVLVIPAFALFGYPGVVGLIVLMAALAATIGWQWMRDVSGSAAAATFGWAAVALTAPFLFNSFTVFPEIPGALAVMIAIAWRPASRTPASFLVRGLAVAALPWLSTKYVPMAAVIGCVWMYRLRFKIDRPSLSFVTPIAISLAGWFAFFHAIWGTFAPSAPYGSQDPMTLRNLAHGFPGLLLDQEYGIVFVAPVLAFAVPGFVRMWRTGGDWRRNAVELSLMAGALIVTVGAFHVWWGGTAAPGRPVVSGILLLGAPIAMFYANASSRLRVAAHAILALSLALASAMAVSENGTLLRNDRDGAATLVEWVSPLSPIVSAFPSFIIGGLGRAAARAAAWIALGALVVALSRRAKPLGEGALALSMLAAAMAGGMLLVTLFAGRPAIDVEARARIPLLDAFDAADRPVAIAFDPFSRVAPTDLAHRAGFVSRAGLRTAPQPIELLWNTRLALPAGEYSVTLTRPAPAADSTLSLQVGRGGAPFDTWAISGTSTEHRFLLPIDASFVGFIAPPELATSGGELRVTPTRLVNASERADQPQVISIYKFGAVTAFFQTDGVVGEPGGFWTLGRATSHVTFVADQSVSSLTLGLRCGPIANRVTVIGDDSTTTVDVSAGGSGSVPVPMLDDPSLGTRMAAVDLKVEQAFVPAELDAASRDRRTLGCFVEVR
jgi:hypothetical protein